MQRKIAAFSLLGVYGLAIWLFCCHGYDLHSQKQQQKEGIEKYHAVALHNPAGEALQPAKLAGAGFGQAHASGKNSFNEQVTLNRLTDQLISSSFIQYSSRSAETEVRFRKADMIFPFHYFW